MAATQDRVRSEKRQRTRVFPVRMTPAEYAELEAIAAAFGTSVGGLLRESALRRRTETPQLVAISA